MLGPEPVGPQSAGEDDISGMKLHIFVYISCINDNILNPGLAVIIIRALFIEIYDVYISP